MRYSVSYRVMLFGPSTDGVYNAPATVRVRKSRQIIALFGLSGLDWSRLGR